MADTALSFDLLYTPYTTVDFDRLEDNVRSVYPFQAVGQLATETTGSGAYQAVTGLGAAGDILLAYAVLPANYDQLVFVMTHLQAVIRCNPETANFDNLFEDYVMYGMPAAPTASPTVSSTYFDQATLTPSRSLWDGGANTHYIRRCSPPANGLPRGPYHSPDTSTINSWGAFEFYVKTWDATAAGNTTVGLDVRFLAYPVSALRAGSFRDRLLYLSYGNGAVS